MRLWFVTFTQLTIRVRACEVEVPKDNVVQTRLFNNQF